MVLAIMGTTGNNMAGLDSVTQTTETVEETEPSTATPVAKPVAAKGKYAVPTPTGTIGMAPGILENMQKMLEEKEARRTSMAEGLADVAAWFPGYKGNTQESLAKRAKTRDEAAADVFQMRNQIAQYKAAQDAQANFEARRAKELGLGGGAQGTAGAAATPGAVGTPGLYDMPAPIRQALTNAKTEEEYKKIYNQWAQEVGKSQLSPERSKLYDVTINGKTYQKPLWWIEQNPGLFSEEGATTNAPVAAPAAPKAVGAETPAAPKAAGAEAPLSVRNNNPGNLVDEKGQFRKFATPEEGEKALEEDLRGKLQGQSPAYKAKFGEQPITPSRLAETWAPSDAIGNSPASTTAYGKHIASRLGIKETDPIPNTPEALKVVKQAITDFEAGTGSGAVTPKAPVIAKAPLRATSKEDAAAEGKLLETEAAERGKSYGGTAADVEKNRANYGTNVVRAEKIYTLADQNPNMLGVFVKPGVIAMTGTGLKEGIKVGPHGQLALPAIEEMTAQMTKGATGPSLQARRDLAQTLHEVELDLSKLLKGQGTVSDAERRILSGIAGSVSDPADLLKKKALVLKLHAEYDKDLGDAFRKSNMPYSQFVKSDAYMNVVDNHSKRLMQNFKNEYLGGKDIPVDEAQIAKQTAPAMRKSERKTLVDRWAK